jgi:hypothetical protein
MLLLLLKAHERLPSFFLIWNLSGKVQVQACL